MSRKYYFDNAQGQRNFYEQLCQAELLSTAASLGPESLFCKYINELDPTAEIVTELSDDAIVLIELNNHVTPVVLDYLIGAVKLSSNTIFVSMTETIWCAEEYSKQHNLKFMTVPTTPETDKIKNLALIQPFLIAKDLYPCQPARVLHTKDKKYRFLNLNRRATKSRKAMYAALDRKKLIAKNPYSNLDLTRGLVSMHWEQHSTDVDELTISDEYLIEHVNMLSTANKVLTIPRILPKEYCPREFFYSHHYPVWYEDTWFSLVTESTARTHYVYKPCITEKTVMPLLIGHPFVLYADNGSVELLRRLGFDTFDWLFDHSYDTETDESIKLKSILRQLKEFDIANAQSLTRKIDEAIRFNRNHYNGNMVKQAISAEWQSAIEELS